MSGDFDGLSFPKYMLAGAAAGIAEHVAMYPVDTVKTRMQALAQPGQNLHGTSLHLAIRSIIRREGLHGLYRGVGAVAWGAGPAHAMYFTTYEVAKTAFGADRAVHSPVATALAGASATVVNDALMTPADVVKQRLQLTHSPYRGIIDCAMQTYRSEGLGAFFRSYRTTLFMNIPFTAVHFSAYESIKQVLAEDETDEGLLVQLIAGGAAGGLSAAVTNPLDVVKTRLQTDGMLTHKEAIKSGAVLSALKRITEQEGAGAIWHGLSARVWFHIPAAAVCWGVYESCKTLLGRV